MSNPGYYVEVEISDQAPEQAKAVLRLRNLVAREWHDRYSSSPKLSRDREIAMALFAEDHRDSDPFELAMGQPGAPPAMIGAGSIAVRYPLMPAWATYLEQARKWLRIRHLIGADAL